MAAYAPRVDTFLMAVRERAWRAAELALRDRDDALDAVQDAMGRLVSRYSMRPSAEWPALFWRILYRGIADVRRHRAVHDRIFARATRGAPQGSADDDPVWDIPNGDPGPGRLLESRQAYAALCRALRSLPRRQQQVFVLRVLEELDVAATARVMRCSAGSVKTHLSRALSNLRNRLGDWQ